MKKWTATVRKACATSLAAVLLATSFQVAVPTTVAEAATTVGMQELFFINSYDPTYYDRQQTVLTGEQITTICQMPSGYSYYTSEPLKVTDTPYTNLISCGAQTKNGNFLSVPMLVNVNGLTPPTPPGGATVDNATVNVRPVFYAFQKESTSGQISYKETVGGVEKEKIFSATAVITSSKDLSTISNSSISFKTGAAQGSDWSLPTIGTAAGTGVLQEYTGGQVFVASVDMGRKTYVIRVNPPAGAPEGVTPLELTVTSTQVGLLPTDTTFTFQFDLKSTNDLRLTAVTPKYAMGQLHDEIQEPTKAEGKYIFLNAGDHIFSNGDHPNPTIKTDNFRVATVCGQKEYNYATGFKLSWDWCQAKADGTKDTAADGSYNQDQRILSINEQGNVQVINRPLADTRVWLIATISYPDSGRTFTFNGTTHTKDTVASQTIEIPITIMGQGEFPKFVPTTTFTGKGDGTDDSQNLPAQSPPGNYNLDVNNGQIAGWPSDQPYKLTGYIDFGSGVNAASKITISVSSSSGGEIGFKVNNVSYTPDDPLLPNPEASGSTVPFEVTALHSGQVKLHINYFGLNGEPILLNQQNIWAFNISDSRPNTDPNFNKTEVKVKGMEEPVPGDYTSNDDYLKAKEQYDMMKERFAELYGTNSLLPIGFSPDTYEYSISLPYFIEKVQLSPFYRYPSKTDPHWANRKVTWTVEGRNGTPAELTGKELWAADNTTDEVTLRPGDTIQVTMTGKSESGVSQQYVFNFTRIPLGSDPYLQNFTLRTGDDVDQFVLGMEEGRLEPATGFQPEITNYKLYLDYKYHNDITTVYADARDPWAQKIEFKTEPEDAAVAGGFIDGIVNSIFQGRQKVQLHYIKNPDGTVDNHTRVVATVTSGDGNMTMDYVLDVYINDPDTNTNLKNETGLAAFRIENGVEVSQPFGNEATVQPFRSDTANYYLNIPYSTKQLRFDAQPESERALGVQMQDGRDGSVEEKDYRGNPLSFNLDVAIAGDTATDQEMAFELVFRARAESEELSPDPFYTVHVTRDDPNENVSLESMTVTDVETGADVPTYQFVPTKEDYQFEVEYTTAEVLVSPKAKEPLLTAVTVDGKVISESYPGVVVKLNPGAETVVLVEITPEAGPQFKRTITLRITRKAPSAEARLKSLTVEGGENMEPQPFLPSTTNYTVDIPKGTQTFTITATPVDPNATITIDGKAVEAGKASEPMETFEGYTRIPIVVTAQDGKTTRTYTVLVRNYNLIVKSTDSTLIDIRQNYGDLQPGFKPNIVEYELYVKPTAMSIDITPVLSDSNATMEVKADSRVIEPVNGVYSTSILKDKLVFTIEVTAEDTEAPKTVYTLTVYRNDEEKQGKLKPITEDMVDFETENPIVVDITTYAVIDASVFNKLKTDYPDKTIIFKGNDYTLEMKASDIKGLVPYAEQYDLFFSFSTPEESLIMDAIHEGGQYDIDPVFLYFDGHGALPGPMTLTVSLGKAYSNRQLFWNYYNTDRDRIDYYGYVMSNGKGSFQVPLTHLSTYLVTENKLRAAENKVGLDFGGAEAGTPGTDNIGGGENISGDTTTGKDIPKTGVKE